MFCCGFVIYDSCSVLFFCITSLVNSRVCVTVLYAVGLLHVDGCVGQRTGLASLTMTAVLSSLIYHQQQPDHRYITF